MVLLFIFLFHVADSIIENILNILHIYKHYLFDSKRIRVYDGNVEILYYELFVVDLYDICGVNFEVMNEVNHRILLGFYVEVDFIDDFVSEIIF
jgi:hypothetical protein